MNPDWLEDCAEGREIFFFVAAGWLQQGNYVSRICVKKRLRRPQKTKSRGKLGNYLKSRGLLANTNASAKSPLTFQAGGTQNHFVSFSFLAQVEKSFSKW